MTTESILTPEQGLFELSLINAENSDRSFEDVVLDGINRGIPPEILTRLKELWDITKIVAGEIIAIGKIIVKSIIDFIKINPELTIGTGLGASVSVLIAGIPFIGPILAPLSLVITTVYGAGVGATASYGNLSSDPIKAAFSLANKFFELLKMIFNAIVSYWNS
jgi:hypothetical protein